tara:strand:- start:132 stop:719 length:588 start_codon:yes stop_codon:yes gene_type:complete
MFLFKMKKNYLILFIIVILISCSKNVKKVTSFKKITLIDSIIKLNKVVEREVYVRNLDTILNQIKIFNSNRIDSSKSHFYNLRIIELNEFTKKVYLKYYSPNSLLNKDSIEIIERSFSYLDLINDSLIIREVKIEPNVDLIFEFNIGEKNKGLSGMIFELFSEKSKYKDSIEIIKSRLFVDAKNKTSNPFIDSFK